MAVFRLWRTVSAFGGSDILMEQPGQAKLTEGFHEYSADVMNTSFSLVNCKDNKKYFQEFTVEYQKGYISDFFAGY